jgi:three-Cys-motif partner protein
MKEKFPSVGKWAKDKLDLLEKYLRAYVRIMSSQVNKQWLKGGFHYIDAFAGAGYAWSREERSLIEGSPKRALQVEPAFWSYHFIEISSERVKLLKKLKDEFPDKTVKIYPEEANIVLCKKLVPRLRSIGEPIRAFIFLDPYGLQVEWETIEFLGALKGKVQVDIFVNFPLMGIHRAALPSKRRPSEKETALLKKVIGGEEVEQVINEVYTEHPTLFPDIKEVEKLSLGAEWLAEIYRDRLLSVFPYTSNAVVMKNSKNAPLYALMLASHNKTAVNIMNSIFEKYECIRAMPK